MNAKLERDPFNTAVAAELKRLTDDFGVMRLVRKSGIPRSSLTKYLTAERGIPIAILRRIVDTLGADIAEVLAEAERRIE